jgi:hypothetical protein
MEAKMFILKFMIVLLFLCQNSFAVTYGDYSEREDNPANLEGRFHMVSEKKWDSLLALLEVNTDEEIKYNFDYSRQNIADVRVASVKYYEDILSEISASLDRLKTAHPITISFAENYLTDQGITAICDFCIRNHYLRENLVRVDLQNNRCTNSSLNKLKKLVVACSALESLDISINYIDSSRFKEVFNTIQINDKIICKSF